MKVRKTTFPAREIDPRPGTEDPWWAKVTISPIGDMEKEFLRLKGGEVFKPHLLEAGSVLHCVVNGPTEAKRMVNQWVEKLSIGLEDWRHGRIAAVSEEVTL